MRLKTVGITLILWFILPEARARAQTFSQVYGDSLTKQAQTIYVKGTVGMTTFESEAAGSKENRTTTETELGGWMGEKRVAGLKIAHSYYDVPFSLNQANSRAAMTDVRLQARIWMLQPSVGVSLTELDIDNPEESIVGLFATGLNAGMGLIVNLHQGLVFNADVMQVHSTRTFDKLGKGTELGDRQDADAYFSFDLTDNIVDFLVGYRMRSYSVIVEDVTYKEKNQGVYAGLRLGFYF